MGVQTYICRARIHSDWFVPGIPTLFQEKRQVVESQI